MPLVCNQGNGQHPRTDVKANKLTKVGLLFLLPNIECVSAGETKRRMRSKSMDRCSLVSILAVSGAVLF